MHDPYVVYWEEHDCKIDSQLDSVLSGNQELVIISTGHSLYKSTEVIRKLLEMEPTNIYDTVGLLTNSQISMLQEKHTISVLGRGDF